MKALVGLMFIFSVTQAVSVVTLKQNVIVKTNKIKVSDFFDGVPDEIDEEIMDAPEIGHSKTFSYDWVDQLAINFKLQWPHKGRPSIAISREKVSQNDVTFVRELIAAYISNHEANRFSHDILIELFLNEMPVSLLQECASPSLVECVWTGQSQFLATFQSNSSKQPIIVKGSATEVITIPVAKVDLSHNHVISENDLDWKAIPVTRITEQTLKKQEEIVGSTIRNTSIKQGTPILKNYLRSPAVIHKGDLIQLKVDTPTLEITLRAKANADGAVGETIQVMNVESKKMIEAVVVDSQTASIGV